MIFEVHLLHFLVSTILAYFASLLSILTIGEDYQEIFLLFVNFHRIVGVCVFSLLFFLFRFEYVLF